MHPAHPLCAPAPATTSCMCYSPLRCVPTHFNASCPFSTHCCHPRCIPHTLHVPQPQPQCTPPLLDMPLPSCCHHLRCILVSTSTCHSRLAPVPRPCHCVPMDTIHMLPPMVCTSAPMCCPPTLTHCPCHLPILYMSPLPPSMCHCYHPLHATAATLSIPPPSPSPY